MFVRKVHFLPSLVLAGLSLSLACGPLRAEDKKTQECEPTAGATPTAVQGGLLPGETREQKRERLVKGIETQVGTLTAEQKTHILAILASAGDEMAAARANSALTADQQSSVVRRVHGEISTRISAALTEAQLAKYGQQRTAVAGGQAGGWSRGGGRFNETREQRRERLIKRYETLTGLTVKQKSDLLAVSDASSTEVEGIRASTTLGEEEKRAAVRKAYADSSAKVDAILTEAQRAELRKVSTEREAQSAPAASAVAAVPATESAVKATIAYRN